MNSLINMALRKFIVTPIASAVAKIIPQHTILKGSLLGFTYHITTRDLGKIIISNSLEHLIDEILPFNVEPLNITRDNCILFQTTGASNESLQLLRAFNLGKTILTKHPIPKKIDNVILNNFIDNVLKKKLIISNNVISNNVIFNNVT